MFGSVIPGREKRIAILHYAVPPIVGGVESTIKHHARLLAHANYDVSVIAGRGKQFHPQVGFLHIPEMDSRHEKVLFVGKDLAKGRVSEEFTTLRDFLVDRLGPHLSHVDVCIVHNAATLHKNLALSAALRSVSDEGDTRIIAWCHDLAWQDELYTPDLHPGYPWDLLRTPWPGVTYVVVSKDRRKMLARLLGLTENEIQVIHPGVDVGGLFKLESATQSLMEKVDLLGANPLMLLPARITRRKNIEFAIKVTAQLKDYSPRATLVVTGPPGPHNPANIVYLKSLQKLQKELAVEKHVCFLYEFGENGKPLHVTDAMMADLYHLADLLLFPSRREGFGMPALEAGLSRLPMFAADIPTLREGTSGFAHYFDPEGDPNSVAETIISFLENDRSYLLKRRVLDQFSWESIVNEQLIPLIHEDTPL